LDKAKTIEIGGITQKKQDSQQTQTDEKCVLFHFPPSSSAARLNFWKAHLAACDQFLK
jgi:hypothetical protein